MLQRIRDEAHRFANTFHGERRSKRMTRSALDGIAGLGETRQAPGEAVRQRRCREAGQPRRAAGDEGDPGPVAAAVHRQFHPDAPDQSEV